MAFCNRLQVYDKIRKSSDSIDLPGVTKGFFSDMRSFGVVLREMAAVAESGLR